MSRYFFFKLKTSDPGLNDVHVDTCKFGKYFYFFVSIPFENSSLIYETSPAVGEVIQI